MSIVGFHVIFLQENNEGVGSSTREQSLRMQNGGNHLLNLINFSLSLTLPIKRLTIKNGIVEMSHFIVQVPM